MALSTLNSTCDARLFWPLVLQINSQCKAKKREAERFIQALDSTFIIGSTLLNEESFTLFHLAQRVLHASSIFATTELPPDVSPLSADRFTRYLTLNGDEDLKNLDYLQLHHPTHSHMQSIRRNLCCSTMVFFTAEVEHLGPMSIPVTNYREAMQTLKTLRGS